MTILGFLENISSISLTQTQYAQINHEVTDLFLDIKGKGLELARLFVYLGFSASRTLLWHLWEVTGLVHCIKASRLAAELTDDWHHLLQRCFLEISCWCITFNKKPLKHWTPYCRSQCRLLFENGCCPGSWIAFREGTLHIDTSRWYIITIMHFEKCKLKIRPIVETRPKLSENTAVKQSSKADYSGPRLSLQIINR